MDTILGQIAMWGGMGAVAFGAWVSLTKLGGKKRSDVYMVLLAAASVVFFVIAGFTGLKWATTTTTTDLNIPIEGQAVIATTPAAVPPPAP